MKRSIGELLFDGYEDTVMELGNSFASEEEEEDDANKIPMDKFGWFYKVSEHYIFNIYKFTHARTGSSYFPITS